MMKEFRILKRIKMTVKIIIKLMELPTLVASVIPVTYASSLAWVINGKIDFFKYFLLVIAMMLVQSSANMVNDYADFKRNVDFNKSGEKVLVRGDASPKMAIIVSAIYCTVALIIGVYLAINSSLWILGVALLAGLVLIFYSVGPKPISYTPLGEIVSGITMGFGINLTVFYIQTGRLGMDIFLASIPTVMFIAMLLLTNNLSDHIEDKLAGRKTMVIVHGVKFGENIWILMLVTMYIISIIMGVMNIISPILLLALFLLFPYKSIKIIKETEKVVSSKPRLMALSSIVGIRFHGILIIGLVITKIIELLR